MTSWNVSDWSYTAEGGKHAIFRYSPSPASSATADNDNEFHGHVLRIAKSDLVSSTFTYLLNQAESMSTSTPYQVPNDCKSSSQTFQKNIIQPLIGRQYIDIGHTVHLSISFCSQLYQQTISSGLIPDARLSTWQKKNCGSVCTEKSIVAVLLRDYTSYLSPPPISAASQLQTKSTTSSKIFSIEIKPKAGYITTSPLVLRNHRCKYQHTRYTLQQELMRLGVIKKGWQRQISSTSEDCGGFTPSQYSPLNLFSNDINQIHNATSDLMNNMQNNLRIWYDGKQMVGLGSDVTVGSDDCQMMLNDMLGNNDSPATNTSNLLDAITRVVSIILHHEHDLLSNILSIQQLDVIDGDGAVMIYERLVQLCNGSNVEAETLLDEALLVPSDEFAVDAMDKKQSDGYHIVTESSPYTFPQHCKSLQNLLDEIEKFDKYMRDHHLQNQEAAAVHDHTDTDNNNLDESIVNTAHIKSIEHINHLSKEGCIYLLQNWLLSLVLCDVSFFITFRVVSIDDDDQEVVTKCQSNNQSGNAVCLLPTKNDALSTLFSSASSSSVAIQYEVKVVDCDPKPAKKLCGRKEIENKFSQFSRVLRCCTCSSPSWSSY